PIAVTKSSKPFSSASLHSVLVIVHVAERVCAPPANTFGSISTVLPLAGAAKLASFCASLVVLAAPDRELSECLPTALCLCGFDASAAVVLASKPTPNPAAILLKPLAMAPSQPSIREKTLKSKYGLKTS